LKGDYVGLDTQPQDSLSFRSRDRPVPLSNIFIALFVALSVFVCVRGAEAGNRPPIQLRWKTTTESTHAMSRYEVVPKLIGTIEKQRGGGVVAERQNAFIRDHEYTASASLINIALLSGNLVNEFVDALGLRLCRLQIIDHWLKKLSSLRNRRFLLFFQILYFRIYRIGTVEGIEINWRALFPEESGRHDNVRVGSAFIEKAKSYQKCFAGVLNSATKEHYIRDGLLLHYFSQGGQDRGLIRSVSFQSFVNAEGFKKYDQCKKGKENACDGRDGQDCASTPLQRKLLFVALSLGTLLNLCVGIYMLNKGTDLFGQVPKWQVDMLTYGGGVIIYLIPVGLFLCELWCVVYRWGFAAFW
jgi:hypothetical protein